MPRGRRELLVARPELGHGQHDDALLGRADPEAEARGERVRGVGGGAGVELVQRAVPEPAVGVLDALQLQRRDALLQAPRRPLRRRPVAEQPAEDRVRVGLADAAEAQRGGADRRHRARAVGPEHAEVGERGEEFEPDADPLLPARRRDALGGDRVEREPAAVEQRVADAHALVAAVGQPELGAQRRARREQVEPRPRRRVDGDDGLAAAEPADRARHLLDRAGGVERGHELHPARGRAPLVQRHELLVAGLGRDVDAAIAHVTIVRASA